LFIRFLVSLQSKLFRTQETPSDKERGRVLDFMRKLERFETVNAYGVIVTADPQRITYHLNRNLPKEQTAFAQTVLSDFAGALQFLAHRMNERKSLF
jgi:hypothetical protein